MRPKIPFRFLLCLFIPSILTGDTQLPQIPGIGPLSIEKVATSGGFTEGPAVLPDGSPLFSDLRTEKVYHVPKGGDLTEFLSATRRINGLMTSARGQLFACESRRGEAAVVVFDLSTRQKQILAAGYAGKPFNRANDLVIDREGGVYFSDILGGGEGLPQPTAGVYYVSREGKVARLIHNLKGPNGVLLSRDETQLYVAAMAEARIVRYPILNPGRLGKETTFYEFTQGKEPRHGGDGMAIDVNGNLYIANFQGRALHVINSRGTLLGTIPFEEKVTNCTFGGPDGRTLYVTSGPSLFALQMVVPGRN